MEYAKTTSRNKKSRKINSKNSRRIHTAGCLLLHRGLIKIVAASQIESESAVQTKAVALLIELFITEQCSHRRESDFRAVEELFIVRILALLVRKITIYAVRGASLRFRVVLFDGGRYHRHPPR